MGSSQESTFSSASAAAQVNASALDLLPVYAKELIAGGAAGAFAKTAVAPLERVKILLQTRTESFQSLGILQSLRKLWQYEGVRGFYKGNGASVLRIVPYAALHYMTYEQYRCWILNNFAPSVGTGPVVDLLAGSAAGGTAVLCTYPLDLARTKLAYQVSNVGQSGNALGNSGQQQTYNGIKDVFKTVYKEGGARSLYRGVGPTLIGILPYAGLKFYIYEDLKSRVPEDYKKSVILKLSCGALAGLFGQTLTYPLDVVRRQMQVQSKQPQNSCDGFRIKGTYQGLLLIIRCQGWRQLFAGLSLNYVKVVPSVAIGFTTYDMMKALLGVPPRERVHASGEQNLSNSMAKNPRKSSRFFGSSFSTSRFGCGGGLLLLHGCDDSLNFFYCLLQHIRFFSLVGRGAVVDVLRWLAFLCFRFRLRFFIFGSCSRKG